MTVKWYCGPPGSGKSYHVVKEVIIPALKDHRKILTNLPVKLDVISKEIEELRFVQEANIFEMIMEDKIRNIHEIVGVEENNPYVGCLIIIDEAHNFWPSDEGIKNSEFKKWFTLHRHFFQDIVIVTQDYENVNKFIRTIMDGRFEYAKNDDLGFSNSYNEYYYLGKSKRNPDKTMYNYDEYYFQFYDSYNKNLASRGLVEKRVGKRVMLLLKPLVTVGVCLILVIGAVSKLFGSHNEKIDAVEEVSSEKLGVTVKAGSTSIGSNKVRSSFSSKGVTTSNGIGVRVSGLNSFDSEVSAFDSDWCVNVGYSMSRGQIKRRGTLIEYSDGRTGYLSGAHKVVGVIGIGSESIYLLRTLQGELVKGVLKKNYRIGEKVCL